MNDENEKAIMAWRKERKAEKEKANVKKRRKEKRRRKRKAHYQCVCEKENEKPASLQKRHHVICLSVLIYAYNNVFQHL